MNHRITLIKRGAGITAGGRPSQGWSDVATVWADVRFQTGAEVLRTGAETSITRVSIRIRSRADIDAAWRVRYQGKEYDVQSVLPEADRSFSLMVCEAAK
jgi:SPP1 family predicted phage head-tail adaptor